MVENEGDDDEDARPSLGSGRKPPTDQFVSVLSKSFPRQRPTDYERVNVVLKGFPRKQRTTQQRTIKTGISEQSIDHERADFLFKGFPGSIDHDVALKGISRKQQKESTNKLLKGFQRFEAENQARMVENEGDDDEDKNEAHDEMPVLPSVPSQKTN